MCSRIAFLLALFACAFAVPCSAQKLVTDIPVSAPPSGVAVNPGLNRIYVSLNTSTGPAVAVIDGSTNTVIDTIAAPQGSFVITANIATSRVYAAGCTFGQTQVVCGVTVIDGNTDTVVASIPIDATNGIGIQGITVNPVTNRIYVADASNSVIDVINGNTNKIVTSFSVNGAQPLGLAFDIGTNELLVTINGPLLDLVSATTNKIARTVSVGSENANVAVNPFTSQAYVTNELFQTSTLGIVNVLTGKVEGNPTVGNTPFGVCVDLFTNLVFVTNKGDGTVVMVNGYTNKKVGSVTANGTFLDLNPLTRLVYVSDSSNNVVHVISE